MKIDSERIKAKRTARLKNDKSLRILAIKNSRNKLRSIYIKEFEIKDFSGDEKKIKNWLGMAKIKIIKNCIQR